MFSISDYINAALDAAYARTAGRMLAQVDALTRSPNAKLQRVLKQLDDEAQRLADEEKRIKADNAALVNALAQYRATLDSTAELINANDTAIQETGQDVARSAVTAKVFSPVTAAIVAAGINPILSLARYDSTVTATGFVVPTALDFAGNYVEMAAWAAKLDKWGAGYANLTQQTILNGIQSGWSPIRTAREMRNHAENIPKAAAENLTRTLQLTSYRDATLAMEAINGDYIEGKIRIARLDDLTCLSCLALHGTPLGLGERVDDHYRGRCDVFYIVPGGARQPQFMQADSTPGNRNFVPYQNGIDWFNSQSSTRQARQASFVRTPAKLAAFRAGTSLTEFVEKHTDDVFGEQVVEASLKRALGAQKASEFYVGK